MNQSQQFFETLLSLRRNYIEEMNILLSHYQLSTAQWLVFKSIAVSAPTTLVEVAKQRSIEKPTATKIIQKLIELQLLDVTPGQDKREKILSLSIDGRRHYEKIQQAVNQVQQAALADTKIDAVITLSALSDLNQYFITRKEERLELSPRTFMD